MLFIFVWVRINIGASLLFRLPSRFIFFFSTYPNFPNFIIPYIVHSIFLYIEVTAKSV